MKSLRSRPRFVVIAAALLLGLFGAYLLLAPRTRKIIPVEARKVFVVGGSPHSIDLSSDAVWLTDNERRSVLKIDPSTGRVEARTRLPFIPGEILVAGGSVWVGAIEGELIARLDGETAEIVDTIAIGRTPQSLTASGDLIWVASFDGGFVQAIEIASSRPQGDPIRAKDSFPAALAYGFDSVWIADVVDDVVDRISTTGEQQDEIPVGDSPVGIVAAEGSVWTANFNERSVSRIDPATGRVGDSILVGGHPGGIAAGAGFVWVTRPSDDSLIRIDVESGSWTGEILKVGAEPQGVVVGDSIVWVANQGDGTISRIEIAGD